MSNVSHSSSVEETIFENQILKSPSTSSNNSNSEHEHHHIHEYLALPNKRVRTLSETERIASGPDYRGVIKNFCRNKGHGFIQPDGEAEPVFLHISDIEGEWCPKEGDVVSFKKALMPPKMQKYQAVHVHFVHLKEGVKHEHWDNSNPNL